MCIKLRAAMRCDAFDDWSFADAHTYFFYATPEEIRAAYPHGASTEVTDDSQVARVDGFALVRAGEIRRGFSNLFCFGVTEEELDPLGRALGLPEPAERKSRLTADQQADVLKGLTGVRPNPSDLSDSVPGSYLKTERVIPDSCTTVYKIPREFVARLGAESNPSSLAERWVRAIEGSGPRLDLPSSDGPTLERLRRDVGRWTKVAAALTRFARADLCDERDLYVEITYDC